MIAGQHYDGAATAEQRKAVDNLVASTLQLYATHQDLWDAIAVVQAPENVDTPIIEAPEPWDAKRAEVLKRLHIPLAGVAETLNIGATTLQRWRSHEFKWRAFDWRQARRAAEGHRSAVRQACALVLLICVLSMSCSSNTASVCLVDGPA